MEQSADSPPTTGPASPAGKRSSVPTRAIPGEALLATLTATAAVVLLAGVLSGRGSVDGRWELETVNDRVAQSDLVQPWVHFHRELLEGHNGCNRFAGDYDRDGSIIQVDSATPGLGGCGGFILATGHEERMIRFLTSVDGIEVDVGGGSMTWSVGSETMRFRRVD